MSFTNENYNFQIPKYAFDVLPDASDTPSVNRQKKLLDICFQSDIGVCRLLYNRFF